MSINQSNDTEEKSEIFVQEAPEGSRVELFSTDWRDRPAPLLFEKHEGEWYNIKKLRYKRERRDIVPVEQHSAKFLEERWVRDNDATIREKIAAQNNNPIPAHDIGAEISSPSSHSSDSPRIRM